MRLAIDGGPKSVTREIPRFNTIGEHEVRAADAVMRHGTLSGFLGGQKRGGGAVQALEEAWASTFGVKHAIACNSATSGLLLACMAARVNPSSIVITTPYTMSATAAAPAFLGGKLGFGDIEDETFCLDEMDMEADAVITTNLFGHPSQAKELMRVFGNSETVVIEDNAQAIFAKEGGKYAGTIGHIGVCSLNVHKHIQCGEGGICVTNDDVLADRIRFGLNHGELGCGSLGLNLRMTEVTAAIAMIQLIKGEKIVAERREIAERIIEAAKPLLEPPVIRKDCTHSFYMIPWLTDNRDWIVKALQAEGVPVKAGYVTPLYKLRAFDSWPHDCPVTEEVESRMITYENCMWSPTDNQLKQFKQAFQKVADATISKITPRVVGL